MIIPTKAVTIQGETKPKTAMAVLGFVYFSFIFLFFSRGAFMAEIGSHQAGSQAPILEPVYGISMPSRKGCLSEGGQEGIDIHIGQLLGLIRA